CTSLFRSLGPLYDRVGARPLVIPGAIGMTLALAGFAVLGEDAALWTVIGCDMLLMLSLGLMMTPLMTDSLGALADDLYSHGSALLTTLQQVAGAFGSAVFVTLAALGSATSTGIPDADGLRLAFSVAAVIGVGAVIVGLLYKRPEKSATPVEELVGQPEES